MPTVLGVIPSRLRSQRLERKALRLIAGRPMVIWVYERARLAKSLDRLLVATDSEEIRDCCIQNNVAVQMTSSSHCSGTDRLVEVMGREAADIYVNIQGDEPMIRAEHLDALLLPLRDGSATQVSTLKVAISGEEAATPGAVKVVTDAQGRALYFSRARIPFDRDGLGEVRYYKHLGIYAYTAAALAAFPQLPHSALEDWEKLEQLRFLDNGIPIAVVETPFNSIGVDTEEDLHRVD
jgi:3-deoxy-manno-octulosonate cytidylyltransferase (CMP-KDO synthetase)